MIPISQMAQLWASEHQLIMHNITNIISHLPWMHMLICANVYELDNNNNNTNNSFCF